MLTHTFAKTTGGKLEHVMKTTSTKEARAALLGVRLLRMLEDCANVIAEHVNDEDVADRTREYLTLCDLRAVIAEAKTGRRS